VSTVYLVVQTLFDYRSYAGGKSRPNLIVILEAKIPVCGSKGYSATFAGN
jgi:hypothetical protein